MTYYVIQDTNIGYVQFVGEASSVSDALNKFDRETGILGQIESDNADKDFRVIHVTPAQADEANAWLMSGNNASECPEWLEI